MIVVHLFRSIAKLVDCAAGAALERGLVQHHQPGRGRGGPALLRRRDQHVDAGRGHVDPDAPEATQSSTNSAPTSCAASATARR